MTHVHILLRKKIKRDTYFVFFFVFSQLDFQKKRSVEKFTFHLNLLREGSCGFFKILIRKKRERRKNLVMGLSGLSASNGLNKIGKSHFVTL